MKFARYVLFGSGVLWVVVLLYAGPLYDFGTRLLRRLGWDRLADTRERMKARLMPVVRVCLAIMALGCLVAAVVMK